MHILSPNLNAQIVILLTDTYFLLYTLTFLTIYLISHRFSSQNISLITIKWFFFSHFHNAYIFFHPHYHNVKKYYFNNENGTYADESSWVLCKKKWFTLQFCIFDFVFWFRDEIWPFFKREFNKQIHTHTNKNHLGVSWMKLVDSVLHKHPKIPNLISKPNYSRCCCGFSSITFSAPTIWRQCCFFKIFYLSGSCHQNETQ